jgi:Holliday junction resolvase RusA-like endonuclease
VTSNTLFTDELLIALNSENPDFGYIRTHIIRAYNSTTDSRLEETIRSDDERLLPVVQWLNAILMSDAPEAHFYRKNPVLLSSFSPTLSEKFSNLSQYNCPLCTSDFPIAIIPIRIRPTSYQASDARTKRAFKKAIAYSLSETPYYGSKRLCVHVTFVVGRKSRRKDADNMAKLLLDALQGRILDDDNQIDHLSLLRLSWEGDEEYLFLNIRTSNVNRREDVLYHRMNHSWAGRKALLLEHFIDD